MKTLSTPIEGPACEGTFLLPADIPANLLRLKPGDKVRVLRYRPVHRVGYRLTAANFRTQASQLVNSGELDHAWHELNKAAGCRISERDLAHAIAYGLCAREQCGGNWRGVIVSDHSLDTWGDAVLTVESTRRVMVGERYPPSVSRSYEYGDEWEPGGLNHAKPVILVTLAGYGFELMSGDLERA